MSYIGRTADEERRMLAAVGVDSFESLIEAIPPPVRLSGPLDTPGPWSEIEARQRFGAWAGENAAARMVSFMGGGIYDHYVPAAVHAMAMRSEFATAYTPYQPEVAQGSLTAIFEFQSLIVELTGTDVANASMYDGSTAMAEAALLARHHTGRRRVVAAGSIHPNHLDVLRTYLEGDLVVVPERDGRVEGGEVRAALGADTAALLVAQPNFFGLIEDLRSLIETAHAAGALAVVGADPVSLGLLEPPGCRGAGADLVVGEGQPFGNVPSFGGPLVGFFAGAQSLVRRMPGRIAAETVDRQGRRGFVLTLQTREQHIRREKATSNICTNQGLLALRATMALALLGREGLQEMAELCVHKTHHAAERAAAVPGYRRAHAGPFLREFALECPVAAAEVVRVGMTHDILAGVDLGQFRPEWSRRLLVAVTEQRTAEEIDRWVHVLALAGGRS